MKVLVVDDNPIVRLGMRAMLTELPEVSDVREAADGRQALEVVAQSTPFDLVFLDVRMPVLDGLGTLRELRDTPVVMLTSSEEPSTIREALSLGARGYLVHGEFGEAEVVAALRTCSAGGLMLSPPAAMALADRGGEEPERRFELTAREAELVGALADGLSNAQIARRLFLTEKTVKNHLNRIYAKMGVASRTEAVAAWLRI